MNKFKCYFIVTSGALVLAMTFALSAHTQQFSDWSAPVNLGPTINTSAFEG